VIDQELVIVLRFYKDDSYAVVLTEHKGKIKVRCPRQSKPLSLSAGTMLYGSVSAHSRSMVITPSHMVWVAYTHHVTAFYIIHHLVELLYYFLPLDKPSASFFYFSYQTFLLCAHAVVTKAHALVIGCLAVAKFFVLLGFHPPYDLMQYIRMYDMILSTYVDLPYEEKVLFVANICDTIPSASLQMLQEWIDGCMYDHPCRKLFKTKQFLDHKSP
jgi:hypothetical protein